MEEPGTVTLSSTHRTEPFKINLQNSYNCCICGWWRQVFIPSAVDGTGLLITSPPSLIPQYTIETLSSTHCATVLAHVWVQRAYHHTVHNINPNSSNLKSSHYHYSSGIFNPHFLVKVKKMSRASIWKI
jgi:hypothetical protein